MALQAKANRQRERPTAFEEAYDAAWFVIDETNAVVERLNKPVFDLDREQCEVVFLMLFNALSDVVSAVYSLSSGWLRPSVIALRGALETTATATAIHHDARKLALFMDGALKIPDAVLAPAKRIHPLIGRLYGALTNQFTHETFDSTARSIDVETGRLLLVPAINSDNVRIYLNVFVEAATLAQMIGISLETCFPGLGGDETHFVTDANGGRSRCTAPSENAIRLAMEARDNASA